MSFLWTKPVSRSVLALRYVAIDAAGLVAAVAIGTLMLVAFVAGLGEAKYSVAGATPLWTTREA